VLQLSDRIGPYNVVIPCTIITAILCLCFIIVYSTAGIIILMAFYGFFSGCFVSIPPTIMVRLSADALDKIGTRLGQGFGVVAVGLLIGTPIGGAILDKSGFKGVWVFGGCLLFGSAGLLTTSRVAFRGWKLMVKA